MRKLISRKAAILGFCSAALLLPSMLAAAETAASPVPVFKPVPFPSTDEQKRQILASPEITVDGKTTAIGFHTILRSGDKAGEGVFGLLLDAKGNPVKNNDGSEHLSNDNDFSSLLTVDNKLFMVSHFESRPGAMYLTELTQDKTTGKLSAISTRNIDMSGVEGLWVPCAGSVTPWMTHLGSEEYPNNARLTEDAKTMDEIEDYDKPMARYFGLDPYAGTTTVDDFRKVFKPYRYGYPVEVEVDASGKTTVTKHFAMGRTAVELAKIMPDNKTAYISDDGTNVGFFLFIADKPKDLSSGKLYAAKWNQISAANGGVADLEWIDLGHADNAAIKKAIEEDGVTFSSIFEASAPKEGGVCEAGFTSINTTDGHECLKLKEGMETIASRVETRRYAAYKGATTEFRKEEGITLDPDNMVLYVAMSEINKGMLDNDKSDLGGPNHIRLPQNDCGAVYKLDLVKDSTIGSDYVAKNMMGFVRGEPVTYAEGSPFSGNTCNVDNIANPDNVTYMPGRDTLIIGEDTGTGHQNDAIWAYNISEGTLTRIQTTPYGAETTSPYFYPNINGHAYLMSVVQHPYGESDEDKLNDPADARAFTGYIGPLPVMENPKTK
ncbi:MAG: DUF839 domain-containing protein [Desulfobulbaceae bacterium]|nr:DUF839 domain-containing protein [Desulfobulbaceae bacterium]